jgi:hypothetical protein
MSIGDFARESFRQYSTEWLSAEDAFVAGFKLGYLSSPEIEAYFELAPQLVAPARKPGMQTRSKESAG